MYDVSYMTLNDDTEITHSEVKSYGRVKGYIETLDENKPLEHVHISGESPTANATKVWITKSGKCYLCHNKSKIPEKH